MNEKDRYFFMIEKLSQKKVDIAFQILSNSCGLVECSNMVQQYLYFGKGCAYVCKCFDEITAEQYSDLEQFLMSAVADLNKLICKVILHEDVPEAGV